MFNLFDIMNNEAGGVYGLGQQYGLSHDQSRRALEALLPALTMGLQRNAMTDPAALGRMFGLFGPEAGRGRTSMQGDLLGQLFGSPALAQAVLTQASSASGIGTQALRQMLPVMAGMVVAGIVHVMLNQPPPAQLTSREAESAQVPNFARADFWNDWMTTFLSSPKAEAPFTSRDGTGRARPHTPSGQHEAPETRSGTSREIAGPSTEMFRQMFQSGIEAQERNVKAMQDLFESFWSASDETAGRDSSNDGDRSVQPTGAARKVRAT